MAGWTGFSDEELARIKGVQDDAPSFQQKRSVTRAPPQRTRQQQQRDKLIQEKIAEINHGNTNGNLDSRTTAKDAKLNVRKETAKPKSPSPQTKKRVTFKLPEDGKTESEKAGGDAGLAEKTEETSSPKQEEKEPEMITDDKEVEKREYSKLEQIQKQQKEIEELNRRKKMLLAKAIADRKKRTQQEAAKLTLIQKELEKMDHLLNVDVSILRDRIDDISREYSEARKRLQKAEEEYVQAKIEFHNKSEMKEQLTEHLYSIIQQNELRKSKKLAELMERMELIQGDEEELPPLEELHPPTIHLELPSTGHHHEVSSPGQHHEVSSPGASPDTGKPDQAPTVTPQTQQQSTENAESANSTEKPSANGDVPSAQNSNSETQSVSGSESKGTGGKPETNSGEKKNMTEAGSSDRETGDVPGQSSPNNPGEGNGETPANIEQTSQ